MTVPIGRLYTVSWILLIQFHLTNVYCVTDPRPGAVVKPSQNDNHNFKNPLAKPRPRIVGGTTTPEDRYPYFVSLLNEYGQRSCGGALVAPDVVMTAAHCNGIKFAQVGRWSLEDELDGYEEFQVEMPMYPHPLYNSGTSFSHDAMLLKLNRQSTKTYLRINDNHDMPSTSSSTVRNSLTTMGFGYTKYGSTKSVPDYLQETSLSYVPNHVCERSKDPNAADSYQGLISDDMLCASDNGQDACQGDSGGPLVVRRETPGDDVLVGIVSWGFGCAHPYYPGVFSRVSYFSEWAKMTICDISTNPPPGYDCGNVMALPTEDDSVPITVVIQLDDHPTETSWSIIRKETDTILVNVLKGTYKTAQITTQETIYLPRGSNNYFRIFDEHGDGLCCDTPGNYRVVLGRDADGEVLVSGGGDFGAERWHEFQVPSDFKEKPQEPDFIEGQIPLTVVIQLDNYPQETGWRIDRLDIQNEEVIRIPAGIYLEQEMIVVRTVILQDNELYNFNIYDMAEDGIEGGKVQLFLGTTDIFDYSRMIFETDGNFQTESDFTFLANLETDLMTSSLLPNQNFVTLELRMDLYPGEITIQLRTSDVVPSAERFGGDPDRIVFFRPPGYYSDYVGATVIEKIPIPDVPPGSSRDFTFIITDRYGDGLCCTWKESSDTGYTLYEGEPGQGSVIVNSKFESSGKEVKLFSIYGGDTFPENLGSDQSTQDTFQVKVIIALDVYPDETGFYIEDSLKRRVVDVPPGTYENEENLVEEIVTLEAGLYSFTILDSFGDGINRADGFYRLEIQNAENRLPLITGNGAFASQESKIFLVEGTDATYPMVVRTPEGSEQLHFDVFRLDLVESEALVGSLGASQGNDSHEHMILMTEGSLYRIVFDGDSEKIDGSIEINLGTSDPQLFKGLQYVVNPETSSNSASWQVKFLAGEATNAETFEDFQTLALRMKFDRFPSEVEWMLLTNDDVATFWGRGLKKRDLIAYGPETLYDKTLEGETLTEMILVPKLEVNRSYTLVVTDAGSDGICCTFGQGGPIELFHGEPKDGNLILSKSFQNGRLVMDFTLAGTPSDSARNCWSWTWVAPFVFLLSVLTYH